MRSFLSLGIKVAMNKKRENLDLKICNNTCVPNDRTKLQENKLHRLKMGEKWGK